MDGKSDAPEIGKLIEGDEQRDAVHVAIEPVVAHEKLYPGQDVGIIANGIAGVIDIPIGIVDPFLKHAVQPAERFWLFLYPRTITSLRHDWTHPAFEVAGWKGHDEEPLVDVAESQKWMDGFAAQHHYWPNYYTKGEESQPYTAAELIEAGREFLRNGERMVQQGTESLRDDPWDVEEYWLHFTAITGIEVPVDDRHTKPFCCTC